MTALLPHAWSVVALLTILPPVNRAILHAWKWLAHGLRRPTVACTAFAVVAIAAGLTPTVAGHAPIPFVHDEFGHLLAADTFLHGRLTNPTPAMWEHFETFHQLMRPTYMSKYPPAQGLAIALGTLLHLPLLGSFGMIALGCAATYWAMRPALGRRFALLGGLLATTHPEIFTWGQGYWTGGVGFFGGALLAGCAVRLVRHCQSVRPIHGFIAGIGLALMVSHRPFEALVTCALTGICVAIVAARARGFWPAVGRMIPPAALVLLPAMAWLGYYNYRVTGHVTELPYSLYEKQYAVAPVFYWQKPRPMPEYRHEDLRELNVDFYYASWLRNTSSAGAFAAEMWRHTQVVAGECFNTPMLAIPALLGAFLLVAGRGRSRRILFVTIAISIGSVAIHLVSSLVMDLHYVQSAVPLLLLWLAIAMRQLFSWRLGRWRIGRALVVVILASQTAAWLATITLRASVSADAGQTRHQLVERLSQIPGKQLVLVRYTPGSQLRTLFEWVFNDADPDAAKIVWARSMNPAKDRELLDYYRDRLAWLLDVDGTQLSFTPLPEGFAALRQGASAAPGASQPMTRPISTAK